MNDMQRFSSIFKEGEIGGMKIKNRIVMAPMGSHYSENGKISRQQIAYFAERIKGGVGLIITENAIVNLRLCGIPAPVLRMDSDEFIEGHGELIRMVHAYGAKIAMQLYHPGRHSIPDHANGKIPVAPSAVLETYSGLTPDPLSLPRELTIEEIQELIDSFGSAARRARHAGYDAVEIHGAHGYLVHQFFSPYTNRRSDIYGGSVENRARFAVDLIKEIKKKAGQDFPVILRITAEESMSWPGYTIEDSKLLVKYAEEAGVNAIHVSMGGWEDKDGVTRNVCPMSYAQGWRLPQIEAIKNIAKIPVIGVGVFREPEFVQKVLEEGKADFIAMGRQLLADPYWVQKTARGESGLIRKCISCNYCITSLFTFLDLPYRSWLRCAVNPDVGREQDYSDIGIAGARKKVMVIGAGPGGMEAAGMAAQRGHDVNIYEKGPVPGAGQLSLTYIPPHKQKLKWVSDFLIARLENAKVKINLNTEVTSEMIENINPDVVIVATGAVPMIPDIPGIDKAIVSTAADVLSGKTVIEGEKVIVLGQYSTGAETAEFLADKGYMVTIVARSPKEDLAKGAYHSNRADIISRIINNRNISILNGFHTKEISDNGILVVDGNNQEKFIEASHIVLAQGMVPVNELGNRLMHKRPDVYVIGDALKPRDIASAIYEGSLIARNI